MCAFLDNGTHQVVELQGTMDHGSAKQIPVWVKLEFNDGLKIVNLDVVIGKRDIISLVIE